MNKNIILAIVIVIFIAIVFHIGKSIRENNLRKKINKIEIRNKSIITKTDSLIIVNKLIDSLNKKDGTEIKQIKKNIQVADSIVNNSNLEQLKSILQRNLD